MPRRPSPLLLTPSSAPNIPTLLRTTMHPTSPSTPLTPPPRLHLRTLLPSPLSPLFPTNSRPPQPKTPYPWIWRCHICHTVYRLGVTRRCLTDGHYFCSLPSPPPSPVLGTGREKTGGKKRKRGVKGCRAEFDYTAWETWNLWREEVRFRRVAAQNQNQNQNQNRNSSRAEEGNARPSSSESSSSLSSSELPTRNNNDQKNAREKETYATILHTFHKTRNCHRFCNYPSECASKLQDMQEAFLLRERERERMELTRLTYIPSIFTTSNSSSDNRGNDKGDRDRDRDRRGKREGRKDEQMSLPFPTFEPLGPYSSFLDPDLESSFLPPSLSTSSQSTTTATWETEPSSAAPSLADYVSALSPSPLESQSSTLPGPGPGPNLESGEETSPIAELADNNEGFATIEYLNGMRRKSTAKIAQLMGLDLGWMAGAGVGVGVGSGNDSGEHSLTSPLRRSFLESETEVEVEEEEEEDDGDGDRNGNGVGELYGVEYESEKEEEGEGEEKGRRKRR